MKRTILAPGHELLSYRIHEVTPYINWIYFFHAWGFQPRFAAIANIHGCDSCRALWLTTFPEEERTKASEAMQLFKEANRMLDRLDETISIHCIFRLCQANADGDNLLIEGTTFPLLRQQTPQPDGGPFLCLSDFVRPLSSGTPDIVGLFASTISEEAEETYKNDPYKHLLVQTLNDRLAEAATEKMHEYVRKEAWGYAPDESLSIPDLLVEKYQGIRSDCFAGTQHAAASSSHGRICRADIFMVCAPKLAFRTIKSKNRTIFAVPNRRARFLPSFGMPRGAGRGKNAQRCGGPLRNAAVHRRLRPAPAVPHLPAAEGSAPRADTVQP